LQLGGNLVNKVGFALKHFSKKSLKSKQNRIENTQWDKLTMAGFDDIVKKAFYMGVGFASYAQEKAGTTLGEVQSQARKLADEMIARGEMTTDEARKFVDDMIQQAQQEVVQPGKESQESRQPRHIEIVFEDEEAEAQPKSEPKSDRSDNSVDNLRQQVQSLQEELRRMKQEKP
jgi:polyhydroxyalkanoate synthesis regulator phasin